MVENTYTPMFHEILDMVHKVKTKSDKVRVLSQYNSDGLRWVLRSGLDPAVKWLLPKGKPPFIPNDAPDGTEHTRLAREYRTLDNYISVNGVPAKPDLNQNRRETLFIQLLEGLSVGEAELVLACKDRNLAKIYKGMSVNVAKEAFRWDDNFMLIK